MNLFWWIFATLACIFIQSFYSMSEMAMLSFNKVRLQYYVSEGKQRAKWIDYLLQNPARLFGTTLLGVNIALQFGSECSREVYTALNLNPDIAPLTQVFLVMIFAELAPMFAARRYNEHVALLGIPIIYASSKLMKPLIIIIGWISTGVNRLVGGPRGMALSHLSREELQHVVESSQEESFNVLVNNIFTLRSKTARDAMIPLASIHMLPADATCGEMRTVLRQHDVPGIPIFARRRRQVVGIAIPRQLLHHPDSEPLRPHTLPPWFITRTSPLLQILKQFRHNNQKLAVVLDHNGLAIGLLTLEDILEEIFGPEPELGPHRRARQLITRTFPGDTRLDTFNAEFETHLKATGDTLSALVTEQLGHPPTTGDTLRINNLEFTILEATLTSARTIAIKTL